MIKLLLGIYDEKITKEPNPLDVGRYYLRIAWLYREEREKKDTTHRTDKLDLTSLEKALKLLQSHFQNYQGEIYDLLTSVETCLPPQMGVAEVDQKREQLKTKYLKGLDKIKDDIFSIQESLDELTDICAEYENFSFASEPENIKITPNVTETLISDDSLYLGEDRLTFMSFLSSLRGIWIEIPLSECEAMKLALKYYKQSYQEERDITQEGQRIQEAYLIAELSRRVGDYQEAENHFKEARRIGEDFIQRNQEDTNKIALARKIVELAQSHGCTLRDSS